mgnify:CR=1 FL=1
MCVCLYVFRVPADEAVFAFIENVQNLCREGKLNEAIQALDFIEKQGVCVPINIYYGLIQSCMITKDVAMAREVSSSIARAGFETDGFLGSHLIHLFASCGALEEANEVFSKVSNLTEFTWIAIISAHIKLGQYKQALKLYSDMSHSNVNQSEFVFITALKACASLGDLEAGQSIHGHIIEDGCESSVFIGNTLIDMYCKCGVLSDANKLFDILPEKSVVSWSAMIAGYVQHGRNRSALELFNQLWSHGIKPNDVTFASILKACSNISSFFCGKLIHSYIIESEIELDEFLGVSLINLYVKCRSLVDARRIFDRLPNHNVVCWSTMLAAYSQNGYGDEVLGLYKDMLQSSRPNSHTFVSVLKACSNIRALEQGRLVHSQAVEDGYYEAEFVLNSLVDMYSKCGNLGDAWRVFSDVSKPSLVRCNAMIEGFAECGNSNEAFQIFLGMGDLGLEPDKATFIIILKACCTTSNLEQGKAIHSHIIRSGCNLDDVMTTTLIHMYCNCGSIEDARKVFDDSPKQDIVTWNAMIAGYAQYKHGQEAAQLYRKIRTHGLASDKITCISVLKACTSMAALELGKLVHARIRELGCEFELAIGNTLIDMYTRCGSMGDATTVFNEMPQKDLVSWTAMIAGHAQHNDYTAAQGYFHGLQKEGLKPNYVTFVSLLSACSHKGLLEQACQQFKAMNEDHGILPTVDHCNCLVDLLGRAGCVRQAEELLDSLPFKSNIAGWTSLLTHCRVHGEVELGRRCFDHITSIDKTYASSYVLMSNIYLDAGMSKEAEALKEQRIQAHAWKKPGKCFIEVDDKVHNFSVGDKSHPRIKDIYKKLHRLGTEMKQDGCLPQTHIVLEQMSDEDKEQYLCGHCEKLAIAFGLISTPPGTPIRVAKNLRVCIDCHTSTKAISKMEGREIIVIDTYRVHHFKDGACSCKDYF